MNLKPITFDKVQIGQTFKWPTQDERADFFIKTYEIKTLDYDIADNINAIRTAKSCCPGLPSYFEPDEKVYLT